MNFSFPIHSKQEQAKIALNNARSIQMAKLGLLKLYEDMQSKKNKLASNNSVQKLSDEKENDDAVRKYIQEEAKKAAAAAAAEEHRLAVQKHIQEEAKKAAAAAAAAAPPNKSFGLNKLLKKINYKKH
jgi:hypothetical protein